MNDDQRFLIAAGTLAGALGALFLAAKDVADAAAQLHGIDEESDEETIDAEVREE